MKLLILLLSVVLISCGESQSEKENREAMELTDSLKKANYRDSVDRDQKMQIEIARKRLEAATGKKDTLTDAEWLEKSKEMFK